MIGIIYQHLNTINGKCYIGQTTKSIEERWEQHLKDSLHGSSYIFHKAIRKYGENIFEHKILCEIYRDTPEQLKEVLDYYECYYIQYYDSYNSGYNMTLGGGGSLGYKFSQEARQKQSEIRQGESNSFYGKHHSKEQKQKWSKDRKGKQIGENNPFYGKRHTEETKSKISKIHKGKKNESQRKKVLCIDTGVVYDSLVDAAALNSIDVSNLSKACRNNSRCKKMKWKYVEK